LPAATQLWEGGEGRGSYFIVVTGEKLGGQKWGCWRSLLEIKEGGQVAGQYVFCSLSLSLWWIGTPSTGMFENIIVIII
jgi:hypothetical protein